jgi:hypothetical protein
MNRSSTAVFVFLLCLAALPAPAVELKKETAAAFDRYLAATDRRINAELRDGPFLFIDAFPQPRRAQAYAQLRGGEILIRQVSATEEGHPIEVPHGLIHDWVGILFIPHATLAETLALLRDYDRYRQIYHPDVRASRLLSQSDGDSKVFLQLYKKSLVTVAFNTDFDVHYEGLGVGRAFIRSDATRIAELQNAGQPGERELPPADSHGYFWRLCDRWRFEEKDGGVYAQLETVALSRSVPAIVAWLVNPLLRSIPRGALSSLLAATRAGVKAHPLPASAAGATHVPISQQIAPIVNYLANPSQFRATIAPTVTSGFSTIHHSANPLLDNRSAETRPIKCPGRDPGQYSSGFRRFLGRRFYS